MALKIVINVSKKMPGPVDYSTVMASCSIEGELAAGQDPAAEATRLYAQAESAVDRQLHIAHQPAVHTVHPIAASSAVTNGNGSAHANGNQNGGNSHQNERRTSLISPAQLRFLRQLLDRNRVS